MAAAAAAQVAARLPSADVWALHNECSSNNNNSSSCSRSSVSLGSSRRSSIALGTMSLNRPRTTRVAGVAAAATPASGSSAVWAVAAEKAVETAEPAPPITSQKTQYHFLIANAKFMLDDEEHFQELMRERLRHFGEQNKEHDFWLVIEPEFLAKFPDVEKRLGRPAVALVSTDSTWITFMKLRLDRVLKGVYEADSVAEALAGGNSSTEIKFEKPGRWTAPYSKYVGDWWTPFLPPQ